MIFLDSAMLYPSYLTAGFSDKLILNALEKPTWLSPLSLP